MAHIYTADGAVIAKAVRDHLNSWDRKPAPFLLGDLAKTAPSLMIQELAAAEKVRSYVDGSYIGQWTFAVYIRIAAEDTAARIDASACLNDLAAWLDAKDERGDFLHLPAIDERRIAIRVPMTMTPSLAARDESGLEDYQAIFCLEYKSLRR